MNWVGLGFDWWLLSLEAAHVMWLRGCLVALGGPKAEAELARMVAEKLSANAAYGMRVASGRGGRSAAGATRALLGHYGPPVRANRRRLTKA